MNPLKWTIGAVEIFQILELEAGALIQSIIKNASRENIREIRWLSPNFADDKGNLKALVQGFLIRSDGKSILIDSCNGNDKIRTDIPQWGNLHTNFLGQFERIGVAPPEIDIVACTHLHMDHVGWNTTLYQGKWKPTFPNARYLFARQEYEYWAQKPEKEIADDKAAFDDSIMPVIEAGLADIVNVDHKIDSHVSFIASPGHTPAHVSVLIDSQGHRALISGDLLHHPCQIAKPQWTTDGDTFPEQAAATRRRILDEIANTETLLIGSHFAGPVAGIVKRRADGLILTV